MDMSFANQLLSVIRIAQTHSSLEPRVYDIGREQDMVIAEAKPPFHGNIYRPADAGSTEILEGL